MCGESAQVREEGMLGIISVKIFKKRKLEHELGYMAIGQISLKFSLVIIGTLLKPCHQQKYSKFEVLVELVSKLLSGKMG